jgi:hypothetical protein
VWAVNLEVRGGRLKRKFKNPRREAVLLGFSSPAFVVLIGSMAGASPGWHGIEGIFLRLSDLVER